MAGDSGNTANTAPTALEECVWDGSMKINVPEGWMTVTDYEDDLLSELEKNDLIESLRSQMCKGVGSCEGLTGYQEIQKKISTPQWKKQNKIEGWDTMACPTEPNVRLGSRPEKKLPRMKFLERVEWIIKGSVVSIWSYLRWAPAKVQP